MIARITGEIIQGIEISVETHPNSRRVASILLEIAGPDRTKLVFPAVKRTIGSPRSSNPKKSEYGWEWPNYRTASLHYAKGAKPGEGSTVVSTLLPVNSVDPVSYFVEGNNNIFTIGLSET